MLLGDQLHWNDCASVLDSGGLLHPLSFPCPLHPILKPSLSTSGTAAHQPCRYHQHGRNGAGRYVCSPGYGSFGPASCPALGCWHAARLITCPAPPFSRPACCRRCRHCCCHHRCAPTGIFRWPSWHHGASPVRHLPENLESSFSALMFVRVCVLML